MPNILVLFIMGSEVRQFGHSGLLSQLIDLGWKVTVAAKVVDNNLRTELDQRIELVVLPIGPLSFPTAQIQQILDKANGLRALQKGTSNWTYKQPVRPKRFRQRLLFGLQDIWAQLIHRVDGLYSIARKLESWLIDREDGRLWDILFDNSSPDILLVSLPKASDLPVGLSRAQARGIATLLLYHTLKDVTVNTGRLNHRFDAIGVWNASMKAQLLEQNPWVNEKAISIVGCSHFDCVARQDLLLPEVEFRRKLMLQSGNRIILFTASAPWVVSGEQHYVEYLYRSIVNGTLPPDLQILVRINPMDDTNVWHDFAVQFPSIIVLQPKWIWQRKKNWGFQQKSDTLEYNNLLYYAALNVSVPSTVTVECCAADLPIVNIGFELPGVSTMNNNILSFWNADYYNEVRATRAALLAESENELIGHINRILNNLNDGQAQRHELLKKQLGVWPRSATDVNISVIKQLVQMY